MSGQKWVIDNFTTSQCGSSSEYFVSNYAAFQITKIFTRRFSAMNPSSLFNETPEPSIGFRSASVVELFVQREWKGTTLGRKFHGWRVLCNTKNIIIKQDSSRSRILAPELYLQEHHENIKESSSIKLEIISKLVNSLSNETSNLTWLRATVHVKIHYLK